MWDFNALEAQPVQKTIYLLCEHMDEKKTQTDPPKKNWQARESTSERIMKKYFWWTSFECPPPAQHLLTERTYTYA